MKATVEQLRKEFTFSERRACRLIGLAVSSYRHQPKKTDEGLREQLITLAREKPRYGYRRLHVLLLRDGVTVNHKRVWRVYHDAGLAVSGGRESGWCGSANPRSPWQHRTRNGRWTSSLTSSLAVAAYGC